MTWTQTPLEGFLPSDKPCGGYAVNADGSMLAVFFDIRGMTRDQWKALADAAASLDPNFTAPPIPQPPSALAGGAR